MAKSHFNWIFLSCLTVLSACTPSGSTFSPRKDSVAPTLIFTRPTNNQTSVPGLQPVVLEFSEFMDRSSVVIKVEPSVSLNANEWKRVDEQDTITVTPLSNWPADSSLVVTVTGQDLAGNALKTSTFRFSTSSSKDGCANIACDTSAADRCIAGQCVCGTGNSPCSAGQVCANGTCQNECNQTTCPYGCCDKGLCYTFAGLPDGSQKTDALHCGTGGVACRASTDGRADRCTQEGLLVCGPGPAATACSELPYCDSFFGRCTCAANSQSCGEVLQLKSKVPDICCPSGNWCSMCPSDESDVQCLGSPRTGFLCNGGEPYANQQVP